MAITPEEIRKTRLGNLSSFVEKLENQIDEYLRSGSPDGNGAFNVPIKWKDTPEDLQEYVLKQVSNKYLEAGWNVTTTTVNGESTLTLTDGQSSSTSEVFQSLFSDLGQLFGGSFSGKSFLEDFGFTPPMQTRKRLNTDRKSLPFDNPEE